MGRVAVLECIAEPAVGVRKAEEDLATLAKLAGKLGEEFRHGILRDVLGRVEDCDQIEGPIGNLVHPIGGENRESSVRARLDKSWLQLCTRNPPPALPEYERNPPLP